MVNHFKFNGNKIYTLTAECVIDLHNLLSNNYHLLETMDPVEPRGVKNKGMLESAVSRQLTGSGNYYKYGNPYSNAATLAFGVIKNHAFHNGNKRAGLLALIKHLYSNGYVISPNLDSEELYEIMISLADSSLKQFNSKYRKKYSFIQNKKEKKDNWNSETEIRFLEYWIKKNTAPKKTTIKGEIRVSELKKILEKKGFNLYQTGSSLKIEQITDKKIIGIKFGETVSKTRTYKINGANDIIGFQVINKIRKDFDLTKSHGVDNTSFYDDQSFLDQEVKFYKQIIYRLSKT